jgi:hypothetical protein
MDRLLLLESAGRESAERQSLEIRRQVVGATRETKKGAGGLQTHRHKSRRLRGSASTAMTSKSPDTRSTVTYCSEHRRFQ